MRQTPGVVSGMWDDWDSDIPGEEHILAVARHHLNLSNQDVLDDARRSLQRLGIDRDLINTSVDLIHGWVGVDEDSEMLVSCSASGHTTSGELVEPDSLFSATFAIVVQEPLQQKY